MKASNSNWGRLLCILFNFTQHFIHRMLSNSVFKTTKKKTRKQALGPLTRSPKPQGSHWTTHTFYLIHLRWPMTSAASHIQTRVISPQVPWVFYPTLREGSYWLPLSTPALPPRLTLTFWLMTAGNQHSSPCPCFLDSTWGLPQLLQEWHTHLHPLLSCCVLPHVSKLTPSRASRGYTRLPRFDTHCQQ